MLLRRIGELLRLEALQGAHDAAAGAMGHDDVVDIAHLRRDEGVGETALVLRLAPAELR